MFENPLLNVFSGFLSDKGFKNQFEKVIENTKNAGFVNRNFEKMMRSVGWKTNDAWCMYYCKLVYLTLYSFDMNFILKNFNGSTIRTPQRIKELNRQGDRRYIFIAENKPQVGDIFCLLNKDGGGGHVGLVTKVINNTTVKTIEGNTSLEGVREGEGVFELERTLSIGKGKSKIMQGYIRRNFTEQELKRLYFDNSEMTFKFK
jgi:hypothetical protein